MDRQTGRVGTLLDKRMIKSVGIIPCGLYIPYELNHSPIVLLVIKYKQLMPERQYYEEKE